MLDGEVVIPIIGPLHCILRSYLPTYTDHVEG